MTPPSPPRRHGPRWGWLVFVAIVGLWLWTTSRGNDGQTVDYSTALGWIRDGKVSEVTIDDAALTGHLKENNKEFHTITPKDDRLVPLLDDKHVTIKAVANKPPIILSLFLSLLPWVLIIGASWWLSRRAQSMMVAGGGPFGGFLKRGKKFERTGTGASRVTFDDVAGLGGPKRDLTEIVSFLKEPSRFLALGAKIPRGVLLVGPPGTGKTLLARAVAGQADVPFYSISASEFVEMFVGVGAARVRELFEEAKKNAPSIVFIDEIDAVGRARGTGVGGGHDEREQTLNQLLSQMDGFERGDLTIVIAATNRPDVLDPALLRPGRFDRRVVVDLPEAPARRAILVVHTRGKPLGPDVDLDRLAATTVGFSGADLENLANEAALAASRRGGERITRDDFSSAYDKIVLGDPRETKLRDTEKTRVAVHESGHATVAWSVPEAEPLNRVSILPRGMALGATHQLAGEDRHLHTRAELEARLRVLLGGYAAERAVLGDISTGAENDLREATRLATSMVAHYGMSEKLGAVYYEHVEQHAFLGQRVATDSGTSDVTVHAIETEARRMLGHALAGAEAAITEHRAKLDALVGDLLVRETLEREDLDRLLGPETRLPGVVPVSAPVPPTRAV